MHSIALIAQVEEMAMRSFIRSAGRDSHHFAPGSDHAAVFEAEYDRCEGASAKLGLISPAPVRHRYVSKVAA